MLKRLFTIGGVDPDKGVAFLENFLPGQAWVLAGVGARKTQVFTFVPQTYGHAHKFIADQLKHKREVKVMMATPARVLTTSPVKEDIQVTRHIGLEVPDAAKCKLDAFERPPTIWLNGDGVWFAVWRFLAPVHPDIANKAEEALAKYFGGKRLNHFLPVPNIGAVRMVEFHKDRIAVPTDFAVKSSTKALNASSKRVKAASFDDVEAKPIEWLWPQVFALGKLNLLGGLPGLGKSQVTLALAAAISNGSELPCDGGKAPQGNVLILASEDDAGDTIKPRLQAAGADMACVFVHEEPLNLAEDLDKLKELVADIGGVRLIILDPISRYVEGANASVRKALTAAIQWAAKEGIALVGIQHPPKGESANVQNLFGGAAAFMQLTRAAWMILPDHATALSCGLMLFAKGNIISDKRGFAYRIKGMKLPNGIGTSRVEFEPQRVAFTADEWMAGRRESNEDASTMEAATTTPQVSCSKPKAVKGTTRSRGEPVAAKATHWLSEALKNGPRDATSLKAEAKTAGISTGALYRAAKTLNVVIGGSEAVGVVRTWELRS